MFSNNIEINFRQKLVVLVGFQIAAILLVNVYCAEEMAESITYQSYMNEMVDHFESKAQAETKIQKHIESEDLRRCCSARDDLGTVTESEDNRRISPTQIWFMEPSETNRANMDQKWKAYKYLLFIDSNKNVYAFDLSAPAYDAEPVISKIKEFINTDE